jgi:hypothetical protein
LSPRVLIVLCALLGCSTTSEHLSRPRGGADGTPPTDRLVPLNFLIGRWECELSVPGPDSGRAVPETRNVHLRIDPGPGGTWLIGEREEEGAALSGRPRRVHEVWGWEQDTLTRTQFDDRGRKEVARVIASQSPEHALTLMGEMLSGETSADFAKVSRLSPDAFSTTYRRTLEEGSHRVVQEVVASEFCRRFRE